AEDGIRDRNVTGVQTCALPILTSPPLASTWWQALLTQPFIGAVMGLIVLRAVLLWSGDRAASRATEAIKQRLRQQLFNEWLAREIGRASCRERVWIGGARELGA